MRYGLIAGNGRFPLLVLESARRLGHDFTIIAIQEEAGPEIESMAPRCHWISLGQLSKLIEILKEEEIGDLCWHGIFSWRGTLGDGAAGERGASGDYSTPVHEAHFIFPC